MSELQSMRVMALHELALAEGVPADAVEDAMDDNDPKTVLIRLVTARRATEPSEVLERDGSVSAVGIGEMLGSGAKAERERAYDLLEACEDGTVAAESVGALTDVLRRKVEEVNAAEWQRAALTLGSLFCTKDTMAVRTEWIKDDRYLAPHARYYWREVRVLAYGQFLESYRSVSLAGIAASFRVSHDGAADHSPAGGTPPQAWRPPSGSRRTSSTRSAPASLITNPWSWLTYSSLIWQGALINN